MDLRQLRYFTHVADAGSFLRAARGLGVSQPALTRQVSALETEMGLVLLARSVRGVQLTEAGARLLAHARTILAEVERARHALAEAKGRPEGSVSLAVSPAVSAVLVAPLVRHFRSLYPEVTVRIVEGFSGHVHEWLHAGRVDLGLLYFVPSPRNLVTEILAEEDLFLIGPYRDPAWSGVKATVPDLARLPLILPSDPTGLRRILETAAARQHLTLNIVLEVDSVTAARELALTGEGYAVLPLGCVEREVRQQALRATRITGPRLAQPLVLASSTDRPLSLAARELARLVRHHVIDLARTGQWPLRVVAHGHGQDCEPATAAATPAPVRRTGGPATGGRRDASSPRDRRGVAG